MVSTYESTEQWWKRYEAARSKPMPFLPCGHPPCYWRLPSVNEHRQGFACGCTECDRVKNPADATTAT